MRSTDEVNFVSKNGDSQTLIIALMQQFNDECMKREKQKKKKN